MANIKAALVESNPWWKKEYVIVFKDREIYEDIRKFMLLPQIIALTGLRRVGKTTLMLKMAEDTIKTGFERKNVVYFSFDEFRDVGIRDVVKAYEELMEKDVREGKCLFLFDEIQKLRDWEDGLKGFYDAHKENAKIVISGSESLFIRKKSKETLAGRIFEFKVEPLSFREFLAFKGVSLKPAGIYEKELSRLFAQFVLTAGFPELVEVRDKDVIRKYVKESIVEKIVYRDIPGLFRIRDLSMLESLLNVLMEEPGQLIEMSDLASGLKVSRQTVSNYLKYLEDSFLVRKLYNFSKSRRKVERKLKKYYPTIVSVDLLFREDDYSRSRIFEWLMVNQFNAEFFWRDPYKNEVDVVLADGKPQPVEIKYGKIDFKGLLAFMKKFKVDEGIIISGSLEETKRIDGKTIHVIPAFKYLLKE